MNQAMISVPCKINGSKICKNVTRSTCNLSPKSVKISSLCIVADDVDILGIFLKSFGAVIVFFCLAASICHSLKRGCFSKKGHNENKWVWATPLKQEIDSTLNWFQCYRVITHVFVCFSYNWPAQTDGVEYGDADEVNKICQTYTWTEEAITGWVLCANSVIPIFYRAIFATSLHSSFDSWDKQKAKRKNCWG